MLRRSFLVVIVVVIVVAAVVVVVVVVVVVGGGKGSETEINKNATGDLFGFFFYLLFRSVLWRRGSPLLCAGHLSERCGRGQRWQCHLSAPLSLPP